ncbi:MAG: ADP-glyceromanno-heptose 6-epimerase [Candidatus Omnitrophica bacterium]|nr:ADP-glyceromanno-heptose 6-epimerase [Candidatus Omnitrophota bacterium]
MKNNRILVTGGAGFIGSALVWALNQRDQRDILITDFLEEGKRWKGEVPLSARADLKRLNLKGLQFADVVEADVFRARLAGDPAAFGRFGAVFHMGACSSTTERNESFLADNNFAATKELAHWALGQGARFIYASSAATYGDGSAGMDDQNDDLSRLRPLNPYGASKQAFDLYAQREGLLDRIVGLKYFNVFGPNEDHKGDMRSVVHKAFHQIRETGRARLFKSYRPDYKDGEQKRDFLCVKDAAEMTLHFALENPAAGGLYNVGSGQAHTWLELVGALFAALGRKPEIEFIEMPAEIRERYQYFTQADISKLRGTGYVKPVTPLAEAVRDTVQNYLVPGRRLGG